MNDILHSDIPFPWQEKPWQQLMSQMHAERLSHAYLLQGPEGIGKQAFANAFAARLLCQQPIDNNACSHCKSCQLIASESHPDLYLVHPEEGERQIKISAVRQLTQSIHQTSLYQGYRVIIICLAEQLNTAAANALLKSLEEPPAQTLFILITHQVSLISTTIRSRCQAIIIKPATTKQLQAFLPQDVNTDPAIDRDLLIRLVDGAPLKINQWLQQGLLSERQRILDYWIKVAKKQIDPLIAAFEVQKIEPAFLTDCLLSILRDMIQYHIFPNKDLLLNVDYLNDIKKISRYTPIKQLYRLVDLLLSLSNFNNQQLTINLLLHLEQLFCVWSVNANSEE